MANVLWEFLFPASIFAPSLDTPRNDSNSFNTMQPSVQIAVRYRPTRSPVSPRTSGLVTALCAFTFSFVFGPPARSQEPSTQPASEKVEKEFYSPQDRLTTF